MTKPRDLESVFDRIIDNLTGRGRGCWPEYKSWCRVPPEWHGQTRIFDLPISRADKIDLATLLFDADKRGIVKNISLDERDELIALCKRLRRQFVK